MRRLLLIGTAVFLLALIGTISAIGYVSAWSQKPRVLTNAVIVKFPKETRLLKLSEQLENVGLLDHGYLFYLWVRFQGTYKTFQAGDYRFTDTITPADLAGKIIRGEAYIPIVLQFNIPEGFNSREIVQRLIGLGVGSKKEFAHLLNNKKFMEGLKIPGKSFEGFLFPATYQFTKFPSAEEVIGKMVNVFWENLPTDYVENLKPFGLDLYQAVTFASLIEAETAVQDEKQLVAEVIWRRLKSRDPLGIDAAIIYGIVGYKGDIKTKHLKDPKNIYNTRIHAGLPPTPICSPSISSLKAILNPSKEGYYYYVLIPNGERRHHFSRTLAEHNKHVQILIEEQSRNHQPKSK